MKEIVVINLMRLGDLIQTTPLLRAIRRDYPQANVTLVVQDVFQETAALLPGYDRLLVMELSRLAAQLDQGDWRGAVALVRKTLASQGDAPPDLVINVTPNKLGAMLAYVVGGRERRGFVLTGRRQFACQPHWMAYMMVISKHRYGNPFNVVDQFTRGAGFALTGEGVALQVPPAAQEDMDRRLAALGVDPGACLIGLQPGASAPVRQWPVERLAATARQLHRELPCHFVLLGTEKERPLGEAVQVELPTGATTSLMGQTSVAALAAAVKRLRLLITNDTGTMHVACGVETPVLAVFLATARILDTGPTGRGHLAVAPRLDCYPCLNYQSCDSLACHQAISPEAVAELARRRLLGEELSPLPADGPWRTLTVLAAEHDVAGYQIYRSLGRRPLDQELGWSAIMQEVWLRLLDGGGEAVVRVAQRLRATLGGEMGLTAADLDLEGVLAALERLMWLARRGQDLAGKILPRASRLRENGPQLQKWGLDLEGVDTAIAALGANCPQLAALVEMFMLAQRCLEESELPQLARESYALYGQLGEQGKIFHDILRHVSSRGMSEAEAGEGAEEAETPILGLWGGWREREITLAGELA